MPTPHISAEPGDFAEAILLPGDPLRAKYIADKFFDEARQVTAVRNMLGFTGTWKGMPVSVMGTGMGIPSASIYGKELVTEYGVKKLVRVGSCGGIAPEVELRDVIVATGACTDSAVNRTRYHDWDFAAVADFDLAAAAVQAAREAGVSVRVGNVHSADLFYNPTPRRLRRDGKDGRPRCRDGGRRALRSGRRVRSSCAHDRHGFRPCPNRCRH